MGESVKFTPGKLTLKLARMCDDQPIFGYTICVDGKIPPIAGAGVSAPSHALIVSPEFRQQVTTGFTEEEVEGYARLFAASAELCAAIKRTIERLDKDNMCQCDEGDLPCDSCLIKHDLRDALASASRGEGEGG